MSEPNGQDTEPTLDTHRHDPDDSANANAPLPDEPRDNTGDDRDDG